MPQRVVTFTTDFGHRDSFVGQLKGAALAVQPDLCLVDLCHEVPPGQVAAGAYVLETGFAAFPESTIHVCVVDPGVGTDRRALAVRTDHYFFVAPDNGVLTRVLEREPPRAIHAIDDPRFSGARLSATFEGRDRFAPAAAWIARGTDLAELGPAVDDPVMLTFPRPKIVRGSVVSVIVLAVDRFGNVVLDLSAERVAEALGGSPEGGTSLQVETPGGQVAAFHRSYGDSAQGEPFVLVNSAGYLELAVSGGRADTRLQLRPGSTVGVTFGD